MHALLKYLHTISWGQRIPWTSNLSTDFTNVQNVFLYLQSFGIKDYPLEAIQRPDTAALAQLYTCYRTRNTDVIQSLEEWVTTKPGYDLLTRLFQEFETTLQPEVVVLTLLDMLILKDLMPAEPNRGWDASVVETLHDVVSEPLNLMSSGELLLEVGSSFYCVAEDQDKSLLSLLKTIMGGSLGDRAASDEWKRYAECRFEGNDHDQAFYYCHIKRNWPRQPHPLSGYLQGNQDADQPDDLAEEDTNTISDDGQEDEVSGSESADDGIPEDEVSESGKELIDEKEDE
ncbi:MAG: hypothetical protein Q9214_001367 [Letrouitia sp. 1 TL-2023]